jgi:hypothetical protein
MARGTKSVGALKFVGWKKSKIDYDFLAVD